MDSKDLSFIISRNQLPDDSDALKDLIMTLSQTTLETITYLKSEIVLLKRFRYGQKSERKKKV